MNDYRTWWRVGAETHGELHRSWDDIGWTSGGTEYKNYDEIMEQLWAIREGLADAPMPGKPS